MGSTAMDPSLSHSLVQNLVCLGDPITNN